MKYTNIQQFNHFKVYLSANVKNTEILPANDNYFLF